MTRDIRIAAHPYGYTREVGSDLYGAADRIFADLASAGYDGIELMHTMLDDPGSVRRLGALSRKHGLPIIGSSFGAQMWDEALSEAILERTREIAGQLKALGGHQLGISTGSPGGQKSEEQLDVQAAVVRAMIETCAREGIVLNAHNHTYELDWNQFELQGMLARLPELKLGPYLNWVLRAGYDPLAFVREHADRIVFLHLRDQADDIWVQSLGEGEDDYEALAALLDEIDFGGWVAVELAFRAEHPVTRPMGENYALSLQHLRQAFGQTA